MLRVFGQRVVAAWIALLVVGVPVAPGIVRGEDKDKDNAGFNAKTAFTRLKAMAGSWSSKLSEHEKTGHATDGKVTYHVTGGGSALVETLFPGSDHEMVSVYHLDGDDLRMTHYCSAGNQPRLKLDRTASTPDKLVFVFDGGTNLDPSKDMHIHGLTMTFQKDGQVDCAWEGYQGGKRAATTRFLLGRSQK
jgi:hypothetical protein